MNNEVTPLRRKEMKAAQEIAKINAEMERLAREKEENDE